MVYISEKWEWHGFRHTWHLQYMANLRLWDTLYFSRDGYIIAQRTCSLSQLPIKREIWSLSCVSGYICVSLVTVECGRNNTASLLRIIWKRSSRFHFAFWNMLAGALSCHLSSYTCPQPPCCEEAQTSPWEETLGQSQAVPAVPHTPRPTPRPFVLVPTNIWLQPHSELWARTAQPKPAWLPDAQKP